MANDKIEVDGVVTDHIRDQWTVELENGHAVKCHLKGKMRKFNIRVIVGDWVKVEMNPYDLGSGIISFRYQQKPEPEEDSASA